jgi:hypothetical protein
MYTPLLPSFNSLLRKKSIIKGSSPMVSSVIIDYIMSILEYKGGDSMIGIWIIVLFSIPKFPP